MKLYSELYRNIGTRKNADFITPKILLASDFYLPKSSIIFEFTATAVPQHITREISYLANASTAYVLHLDSFGDTETIGKFRFKNDEYRKLIKENKKRVPEFKYIRPDINKLRVPDKIPFVISSGYLQSFCKYSAHYLNGYYRWYNTLSVMLSKLTTRETGSIKHKYLTLELPYMIPELDIVKMSLGEVTRKIANQASDYKYFNFLEIMKFIGSEDRSRSLIAKLIPVADYPNTDIVFVHDDKVVLVNLGILASISELTGYTGTLKALKPNTAIKFIYVFIFRMIQEQGRSLSELINNEVNGGVTSDFVADGDNVKETPSGKKVKVNLDIIIKDELDTEELTAKDRSKEDIEEYEDENRSAENTEEIVTASGDVLNSIIEMQTFTNANSDDDTTVVPGDISSVGTKVDLTNPVNVKKHLDKLHEGGVILKPKYKRLNKILEDQPNNPSPYLDGSLIKDNLTYNEEDIIINSEESKILVGDSVKDKDSAYDPIKVKSEKYLKTTYKKDILSTIYSMQNSKFIIAGHEISEEKSILGSVETHKLKILNTDGGESTVLIKLPILNEDGTFRLNGNDLLMRTQRADIPIRKIDRVSVGLTSYYGKLRLSKATYKKDDVGFWYNKRFLELYENDPRMKSITAMAVNNMDSVTPPIYGQISRYFKGFEFDKYIFDFEYDKRKEISKNFNVKKLEGKELTLVGKIANKDIPLLMRYDGEIFTSENGKLTGIGTIPEILGIPTAKMPMEYINIKLFKTQIPLVVLMGYYLGLDRLIKVLDVDFRTLPSNKRVKLEENEYAVKFKDITYIFTKDHGSGDLILAGLNSIPKLIKTIPFKFLTKRDSFNNLFSVMKLPTLHINEITLLEDMYLDPMTIDILGHYKLPQTFIGVLSKASELLVNDDYVNPKDMSGILLKGNERIAGMLYKELVTGIRITNNKSYYSKSKLAISPYSVINAITTDSSVVLVNDLNPIAMLKQREDTTFLGSNGRTEQSMSMKTRLLHPSEIGITSEGTKDSGAVGISSYLSANPKLVNVRGTTETDIDVANASWSSLLSTSASLSPFSTTDDPKRTNFSTIQADHVIPTKAMHPAYVRSDYDEIFAIRAPDKFVVSAKADGVVVSATKNKLVVKYADAKTNTTIPIKNWTTKEISSATYTHVMTTDLSKGDKFLKDDTLVYDSTFFAPNLFNPKRVIYNSSAYITVALLEDPQTYEDSGSLHASLGTKLATTTTMISSRVINSSSNVTGIVKVGDEVDFGDTLYPIIERGMGKGLDKKTIEILSNIKSLSVKSKYKGKISKIVVMYNTEYKNLSKSLRELVDVSDAELLATEGHTGRVDSGYSIKGNPLLPDTVEIKVYIDVVIPMGSADKALFGNQLKFTVGEPYSYDIISEDGTAIEGTFSTASIQARITNSPDLMGTTATLLDKIADAAIAAYF